uniref:Kinesin motor domain-containing protein n=1 Tax=Seriola lalandi dorsalis TaxID=1841481 RepID=A0A3B4YSC5_SERLL
MKAHSSDVVVFVRIRPTANFAQGLIECLPDGKLQESKKGRLRSWSFRLEGVLQNVSQEEVYTRVCRRVVQGALDGYNGRS